MGALTAGDIEQIKAGVGDTVKLEVERGTRPLDTKITAIGAKLDILHSHTEAQFKRINLENQDQFGRIAKTEQEIAGIQERCLAHHENGNGPGNRRGWLIGGSVLGTSGLAGAVWKMAQWIGGRMSENGG